MQDGQYGHYPKTNLKGFWFNETQMIKEAFLICALALPVLNIRIGHPKEYDLLVEYAKSVGADMVVLRKGIHKIPKDAIPAPFSFHGMTIYLKRNSA